MESRKGKRRGEKGVAEERGKSRSSRRVEGQRGGGREQKRSGKRGEEGKRSRGRQREGGHSTYMLLCLMENAQRGVGEFGLHSLLDPVIHVDAAGCSR